ncbi:retrovirus-related pol polyprotein from transposon TNT 1-94 [Tanacetum coccineum]
MMKSSLIYLLSKVSKNRSWLWHRRLNHLNFSTINDLARKDLVRGLPRLKFEKDHLCSACQLGKSKKHTHKPKPENTNLEVLNTLHMDLCGPMRVQTINGKKYILVIVDDYSRFTWVKFLRSKDETPAVVIKFLKQIQFSPKEQFQRTPQPERRLSKDETDGFSCSSSSSSVNSAGTPSSTIIDQDAHSPSHSSSFSALQSSSLLQGVAAESTLIKDNPFAPIVNNPFINIFAPKPSFEASSFGDLSSAESPYELVPQPDCVMIIALKWIYKVKLDEYGDVLKNKASAQVSKQASGSTNTLYDLVSPATGDIPGGQPSHRHNLSTEDLQRAAFTTPPQTAPGTNTTEPPPPPIRNKGPELGADNLTLEGVATELAPSDFVSQNYETLVALMQEETKKRSSQSLQARLNFGPEDEVSPPRHRKERRRKDNRRPPVFGRIGKQVSGTQ